MVELVSMNRHQVGSVVLVPRNTLAPHAAVNSMTVTNQNARMAIALMALELIKIKNLFHVTVILDLSCLRTEHHAKDGIFTDNRIECSGIGGRFMKILLKDIDECATGSPCFTGVECKNTAGSFYCKGNG